MNWVTAAQQTITVVLLLASLTSSFTFESSLLFPLSLPLQRRHATTQSAALPRTQLTQL